MSCQIKNNAELDLADLQPHLDGMYDHFDQKLGFQKPPVIVFDSDPSNQSNVLGKTAYYDPQSLEVHIFIDGRHPKDMLRSIAHELIHHHQNMEGRLDVGGYNGPGYYLENDKMKKIEQEAMLKGNAILREYEDGLKLKEMNEMSLKEWKNNELNGLLLKKFGILNESKDENGLTAGQKKLPQALQDKIANKKSKSKKPTDDDKPPKGGAPVAAEEEEAELEEGRLNARTTNADKFVGHEDRYQPDRIHETEELEEGTCEKCGKQCGMKEGSCGDKKYITEEDELEEGGMADSPNNAQQSKAGRGAGGRHKRVTSENLKRSIRNVLKENRSIRLKIKRK